MSHTRRDFIKTVGAAGLVVAGSDLIADLLAQTPPGRVMDSKFKGLADIALKDAKAAGCSYVDIRFTRSTNSGVNASGGNPVPGAEDVGNFGGGGRGGRGGGGGFGGGFGGRGGGGGGRRGGGSGTGVGAAGFGVRVIHSGTWGFASSPIVTEDEIRRITKIATEIARASAIAKKTDVKLAPVQAYQAFWATPIEKNPDEVPREARQDFVQKVVDAVLKNKDVQNVNASVNVTYEWKYFASSEGSYIEQENWLTSPTFSVTARKDDVVRTRNFSGIARTGGWEVAEAAKMLDNAERIARRYGKDDITTLNQLHLEVNRPVLIRITSKDVIHSFSLPYMRVKQDAVPGMEVPVHFTPIKVSGKETWEIACAQLCGLGHYRMRGQYEVQTKADFDKWMAEQVPLISQISG